MSRSTGQPEARCGRCRRRLKRLGTFGRDWAWAPCPAHPDAAATVRKASR